MDWVTHYDVIMLLSNYFVDTTTPTNRIVDWKSDWVNKMITVIYSVHSL